MPQERGAEVQGVPVTARNWQDPPFTRWAYWHVGEILPTYRVPRGREPARALPAASKGAAADLLAIGVTRAGGATGPVRGGLAHTLTHPYVVLQDGELVTQWYRPQGGPAPA